MIEREKRWKINNINNIPSDKITDKFLIEQTYAYYKPDLRIRKIIRQGKDEFTHCAKYFIEDGDREEIEQKISKERYERIFKSINKKPVIKERTVIDISEGLHAEVDSFLDTGDIIVEVEFKTKEQKDSFSPPDWFGEEIKFNKSFSYSVFAKINNINNSIWD